MKAKIGGSAIEPVMLQGKLRRRDFKDKCDTCGRRVIYVQGLKRINKYKTWKKRVITVAIHEGSQVPKGYSEVTRLSLSQRRKVRLELVKKCFRERKTGAVRDLASLSDIRYLLKIAGVFVFTWEIMEWPEADTRRAIDWVTGEILARTGDEHERLTMPEFLEPYMLKGEY